MGIAVNPGPFIVYLLLALALMATGSLMYHVILALITAGGG